MAEKSVCETVKIELFPARRIALAKEAENAEALLAGATGQPTTAARNCCTISPHGHVVLDFGKELFGGIEFVTAGYDKDDGNEREILVTFGESLSETFSHPHYSHALQEWKMRLAPWALLSCGELGFRFVKIENLSAVPVVISEVRARFQHNNVERLAAFECSDARVNAVFEAAATTLELCTRRYFWDGIKRDKLVWMGDLYPELRAAEMLFGNIPEITRSLDYMRDETPLPRMMNGSSTYSLWWILAQSLHFRHTGDLEYLKSQHEYLASLLRCFAQGVQEDGHCVVPRGFMLLDWATGTDEKAAKPTIDGNHAIQLISLRSGAELCRILGDDACAVECDAAAKKMLRYVPETNFSAASNALLVLAGLQDAKEVYEKCFAGTLPAGMSTFLGPFILDACVMAGHKPEALEVLKRYYGGMLDLGSTTYWEHFDTSWLKDAAKIDELAKPGEHDVHREYGEGCFTGYRNSFCHGWGSGAAEWLLRNILGVSFVDASTVRFRPDLCGMSFVRGKVPSIYGMIEVEVTQEKSEINAPKGIKIIR